MDKLLSHYSFFEKTLIAWYQKNGRRHLPWRERGLSPYAVWVSEVMLQQTQVERVISYYTRFMKRFPTIERLAVASWEDFLPYYEGLGYYRRGRNMLTTAKIIVEKYQGRFPNTFEELLKLPGIGEYTASAILSFGLKKPALAFDTNFQRVLGRFFYGFKKAEVDREGFFTKITAPTQKLNAAVMDFANSVCKKTPRCEMCPLQKNCRFFQTKGKKEIAVIRRRFDFPIREAAAIIWLHQDHKIYFSPSKKSFQPFIVAPECSSRQAIKDFFLKKYKLRLSVRPPHGQVFYQHKPAVLINAQIIAGSHNFGRFSKPQAKEFLSQITTLE